MPLLSATRNIMSAKAPKKKMLKKKAEEIKEKLTGKIYSPIVAKVKSGKITNRKKITVSDKSPKNLLKNEKSPKLLKNEPKLTIKKPVLKEKEIKLVKFQNLNDKKPLKRKTEALNDGPAEDKKKKKVSQVEISFQVEKEAPSARKSAKKSKEVTLKKTVGKKSIPIVSKASSEENADTELKMSENAKKSGESTRKSTRVVPKKLTTLKESNANEVHPTKISSCINGDDLGEDGEANDKTNSRKSPRKSSGALKPISNIKTLKKNSNLKARALKKRNNLQNEKGVCVFKNIPHGFYEKEIKKYCSQFGKVTGVYHPVSKNGNSKGYAFVEFAHKDVAQVVAETMNNYVMFYKRVRCEFVPKEQEKPWVFKRAKTNQDMARERREAGLKQRTRQLTKAEVVAWGKRKQTRINALHKKLASLGVDYQFQVGDKSEISLKETKKQPSPAVKQ